MDPDRKGNCPAETREKKRSFSESTNFYYISIQNLSKLKVEEPFAVT